MAEIVRYSEAFKLQVVRELEEGKYPSAFAVQEAYGIRGTSTVIRWLQKYGKNHLLRKVLRVETAEEVNEVKELRKRVRELEKALVDAHIEHRFDEAYLQIACGTAGINDIGEF